MSAILHIKSDNASLLSAIRTYFATTSSDCFQNFAYGTVVGVTLHGNFSLYLSRQLDVYFM